MICRQDRSRHSSSARLKAGSWLDISRQSMDLPCRFLYSIKISNNARSLTGHCFYPLFSGREEICQPVLKILPLRPKSGPLRGKKCPARIFISCSGLSASNAPGLAQALTVAEIMAPEFGMREDVVRVYDDMVREAGNSPAGEIRPWSARMSLSKDKQAGLYRQ